MCAFAWLSEPCSRFFTLGASPSCTTVRVAISFERRFAAARPPASPRGFFPPGPNMFPSASRKSNLYKWRDVWTRAQGAKDQALTDDFHLRYDTRLTGTTPPRFVCMGTPLATCALSMCAGTFGVFHLLTCCAGGGGSSGGGSVVAGLPGGWRRHRSAIARHVKRWLARRRPRWGLHNLGSPQFTLIGTTAASSAAAAALSARAAAHWRHASTGWCLAGTARRLARRRVGAVARRRGRAHVLQIVCGGR